MKLNRLASTLLVAGLAFGATASHADGLKFFPGMQSGFKFEPSVAVSAGVMSAAATNDDSMFVYGLDINMNLPLGSGFSVGAGPVLGAVMADNGRTDKTLFGYGAVVGANYRKGMYYSGLDLRYLNTTESAGVSFENVALMAKVGINF